jgi:hypothetical protein
LNSDRGAATTGMAKDARGFQIGPPRRHHGADMLDQSRSIERGGAKLFGLGRGARAPATCPLLQPLT